MAEFPTHSGLKNFVRMPAVFGASPGPRNLPAEAEAFRYASEGTYYSITAICEAEPLARLLPPGLVLGKVAALNITIAQLRNLGWLAGRGYNLMALAIPARMTDGPQTAGNFLPVVWENFTDPIITGREEIAYPKIYGDVADPVLFDGKYTGSASWDRHRFFEFEIDGLVDDPGFQHSEANIFTYKYVPSTFAEGQADVEYLTMYDANDPDHRAVKPEVKVLSSAKGRGSFRFLPATWRDMPTQFHIVNALADIPLLDFKMARVSRRSGQEDFSGHRRA